MVKKRLNLLVNEDLIKKAREYGINLSAFLEIKLREYLALIDKNSEWARRESNPRPSPREGDVITTRPRAHGRGGIRTRDRWLRRPAPYPG